MPPVILDPNTKQVSSDLTPYFVLHDGVTGKCFQCKNIPKIGNLLCGSFGFIFPRILVHLTNAWFLSLPLSFVPSHWLHLHLMWVVLWNMLLGCASPLLLAPSSAAPHCWFLLCFHMGHKHCLFYFFVLLQLYTVFSFIFWCHSLSLIFYLFPLDLLSL